MKNKFSYGDVEGKSSGIFRENLYGKVSTRELFKDKILLDLGCGYGLDSFNFSKYAKSVTGSDLEYNPFWDKIKNTKIKFIQSPSEKLPFKDKTFNGVYMKDLLHHVENVEKTLKEAKRVSSEDANIIILEGNRYNPIFYFLVTKIRGHEHFTQTEFRRIILKHFPNAQFLSVEAYPPFFFNERQYKIIISIEKIINKFSFLSPFFSYNAAIIKGRGD